MRRSVLVVLLVCTLAVPAAAGGNEPPLADAGLDQEVRQGETVLLDAAASRDPDGAIEQVAWRVEAPNGTTFTPRCGDCTRARFPAERVGTYTVTLTVTDDDGASRTDRLRVRVRPRPRPTVALDGPSAVVSGAGAGYRARIAARNGRLARVEWTVDGRTVARRYLSGSRAVDTLDRRHVAPGRTTVRIVVYTVTGRRGSDTHAVRVWPRRSGGRVPEAPDPVTDHRRGFGTIDVDLEDEDDTTPRQPPDPEWTPTAPENPPAFELNDARRRVWLAPRDDPGGDHDQGVTMPAGFGDGGGASAAVYVGGDPDDESTEFVPVAAHAVRGGDGGRESGSAEVHVRGLNGGNVTAASSG